MIFFWKIFKNDVTCVINKENEETRELEIPESARKCVRTHCCSEVELNSKFVRERHEPINGMLISVHIAHMWFK